MNITNVPSARAGTVRPTLSKFDTLVSQFACHIGVWEQESWPQFKRFWTRSSLCLQSAPCFLSSLAIMFCIRLIVLCDHFRVLAALPRVFSSTSLIAFDSRVDPFSSGFFLCLNFTLNVHWCSWCCAWCPCFYILAFYCPHPHTHHCCSDPLALLFVFLLGFSSLCLADILIY